MGFNAPSRIFQKHISRTRTEHELGYPVLCVGYSTLMDWWGVITYQNITNLTSTSPKGQQIEHPWQLVVSDSKW